MEKKKAATHLDPLKRCEASARTTGRAGGGGHKGEEAAPPICTYPPTYLPTYLAARVEDAMLISARLASTPDYSARVVRSYLSLRIPWDHNTPVSVVSTSSGT